METYKVKPQGFWNVLGGTERSQAATMVLEPGKSTGGPDNRHNESDQWLYVLSGNGEAIINEKKIKLAVHDLILIKAGENHEIKNTGDEDLKTLNFYAPREY